MIRRLDIRFLFSLLLLVALQVSAAARGPLSFAGPGAPGCATAEMVVPVEREAPMGCCSEEEPAQPEPTAGCCCSGEELPGQDQEPECPCELTPDPGLPLAPTPSSPSLPGHALVAAPGAPVINQPGMALLLSQASPRPEARCGPPPFVAYTVLRR